MNSEDLEKSRTRLKKEAEALQKIGAKLAALSDEQLRRINLPTSLIEAVTAIRTMRSHGARRRQLQYIGALMRHVEVSPIEQALMDIDQGAYRQAKEFQRIEQWRDRLVEGDDEAYTEILERFPRANRQRLGQLVRSARKERQNNKPPKSYRNLFRYLRALADGE